MQMRERRDYSGHEPTKGPKTEGTNIAMKIRPLPLDDQPKVRITNKGRTLCKVLAYRTKM